MSERLFFLLRLVAPEIPMAGRAPRGATLLTVVSSRMPGALVSETVYCVVDPSDMGR